MIAAAALLAVGAVFWLAAPKLGGSTAENRAVGLGFLSATPLFVSLDITLLLQSRRRYEAFRSF